MRRGLFALRTFFWIAAGLAVCFPAWANNLAVSNASLVTADITNNTIKVQFDISWDNSWRNNINRDAAWVFVKYSTDSGTTWNHATLGNAGTNPTGFSAGSGTSMQVVVPTDFTGAFIERASNGSGSVSVTSVQLLWNYGTDGLADTTAARVRVFGIEMVLIPAANFYIGDGNATTESANALHVTDNTSVQITTTAVSNVTVDTNANDDIDTSAISVDGDGGITGNTSWPVGYSAFYVMKHEITQGQYAEFLNTLSRAQQKNRVQTDISGDTVTNIYVMSNAASVTNRNAINCPSSGNGTTNPITFSTTVSSVDKKDRACNYLNWPDVAAFLDWAALRPFTETEYEKAARGTASTTVQEYAWGNTTITAAATISGTENGTETITTSSANACYNNTTFTAGDASTGPLRAGIFATSTSTRTQSGASFYGVMELSGNAREHVVFLGNSTGRSFTGTHGNGVLTTTSTYEGNATNTDWPGIDGTQARGVTGATGAWFRGGSWSETTQYLRISDRNPAETPSTTRDSDNGGRGGRTAP